MAPPLPLLLFALLLTILVILLHKYADKQTHPIILLVTFVGWILPATIIILLPADISSVRTVF